MTGPHRSARESAATLPEEREAYPGFVRTTVAGVFVAVALLGVSSARLAERSRVEARRTEAYASAARAAAQVDRAVAATRLAAFRLAAFPGAHPGAEGLPLVPLAVADATPTGSEYLDRLLGERGSEDGAWVAAPVSLPELDVAVVAVASTARNGVLSRGAVALPAPDLAEIAGLASLEADGYGYVLRVGPAAESRGVALVRSSPAELSLPVSVPIPAAEAGWSLEVAPAAGWGTPLTWWPSGLAAVLAAFVAALFVNNLLRRPRYVAERLGRRLAHTRRANEELLKEVERRKELERRLSFRTSHDELTRLPTRQHLLERLERAQTRNRALAEYGVAVLCVGLDRFKFINESLGRDAGDDVLRVVTERLDLALRPGDTLARTGGDQFAAVLYDLAEEDVAASIARRVRDTVAEPVTIGGREVFITASVGIAVSTTGYDRPGDVLKRAETAMHSAKETGRGAAATYTDALRVRAAEAVHLEADLRRALRMGEFRLHFQPIHRMSDRDVAGAEVLVRWPHPLEGLIPPARFVSLAEESHLIVDLDRWILERAAEQVRAWRDGGIVGDDFYVSVNVSGKHLAEPDLVEFLRHVYRSSGAPAHALRLEVTEGVLMSSPHVALRVLEELREGGTLLLLDDFGTGYSSLSYLHRFPFDVLKIDQSFVRSVDQPQSQGVVRAVVALAESFGMDTVAEGAETSEQVAALEELHCTYVQGYHFSRPLSADDFPSYLAGRPQRLSAPAFTE